MCLLSSQDRKQNEKKRDDMTVNEKKKQMFTITNILKLKMNVSMIQIMIHVRMIKKLQDYRQKSNKADRNELKNKMILL